MSLLTDIRHVSDSAIEQLSGQFHDLPRPLLAAIGAGDMAVERLATLREQLTESIGTTGGTPSGDDVKAFAADLPARAQKVAGDVAHNLEQFAASAPEKAQQLIGELPTKASELADSLSPNNIRGTVEAYTQLVAMIYGNLAERGSKATDKVRAQANGVVDAPSTPTPTATSSTRSTASSARSATSSGRGKASTRRTGSGATTSTGTTARSSAGTSRRSSTSRKPPARKPAARGTKD